MSATARRTVSIPADQAKYIDDLVRNGGYASAGEVLRAGVSALQERDASIEQWLRDDVLPVYRSMVADPSTAISSADVFASIRDRHAKRLNGAP